MANTPASAKALYNLALKLPHTATRKQVLNDQKIAINGPFKANVVSRSSLLYAFNSETLEPLMLKIPQKPAHAKHEVTVWKDLNKDGPIPHLAERLSLVSLKESVSYKLEVLLVLCVHSLLSFEDVS